MKKTSFQRENRVEAQVETKYQMAFEVHIEAAGYGYTVTKVCGSLLFFQDIGNA